jgi:hypothetical protein
MTLSGVVVIYKATDKVGGSLLDIIKMETLPNDLNSYPFISSQSCLIKVMILFIRSE